MATSMTVSKANVWAQALRVMAFLTTLAPFAGGCDYDPNGSTDGLGTAGRSGTLSQVTRDNGDDGADEFDYAEAALTVGKNNGGKATCGWVIDKDKTYKCMCDGVESPFSACTGPVAGDTTTTHAN